MHEGIYHKLAQRLDATPNGFPTTESGVELRLLAKIFAPEEATLAAMMGLTPELPSEIAARTGMDPGVAQHVLSRMAEGGLIFAEETEGQLSFRLIPFVVGIYENQLSRMDTELAVLFEQYYQETQGLAGILRVPSVHRVIPVEESIPFGLEIFPYERASELLEGAKSWGVRDCICRVQQGLLGKACGHPVEVCLVFSPVEGSFDNSEVDRPLTKREALDILCKAMEAGLVHSTGNYQDGNSYICNCCTCSCGILRAVAEFGHLTAVAHSDFWSVVDAELCNGCGNCVEHCQFGALSVPEDVCVVDHNRCMGCGLCVTACSTDALHLERLPHGKSSAPPTNREEWKVQRIRGSSVSPSDAIRVS